jgi:hypothetical protein
MNVASLELCKELYELSGWDDGDLDWWRYDDGLKKHVLDIELVAGSIAPAYNLGYLMRKLPNLSLHKEARNNGVYTCAYWLGGIKNLIVKDDTPEDAACKLAIELFKQGVLK